MKEETSRLPRTDSCVFLLLLVLAALLLAHAWAAWILPPFNSNHLGCDACHHAILIHCNSLADPVERRLLADVLADYPQLAHFLSAQWMPLLGGDAYKAMRASSMASVLLMLACQFALLRRFLPAGAAVLAVLAWQLLCYLTNLANVQYYSVAYFFSQAIGMTFFWAALVLATWPAPQAWQRGVLTVPAVLAAAVAYQCHVVPGVAILGGLGLYYLVCWWQSRHPADLARLGLVGAVGLALVLHTLGQLAHLGRSRQDMAGVVPLKNWSLLLAWIPTLLLSLGLMIWRRSWLRGNRTTLELIGLLTCVLFVTGLLQAYCGLEFLLGKSGLYSVNKFFYVLFPVSSLIWLLAILSWLEPRRANAAPLAGLSMQVGQAALIGLLLYLNSRVFVTGELKDEKVERNRHPVPVCRLLAEQLPQDRSPADPGWRSDLIYYDPELAQSSVFVNIVGLRRTWSDAFRAREALTDFCPGQTPPAQLRQIPFSRLIVPPGCVQGTVIGSR